MLSTLHYWRAAEAFSFIDIPKRLVKGVYQQLHPNSPVPWGTNSSRRGYPYFDVYVGVIEKRTLYEHLRSCFGEDEGFQEMFRPKGFGRVAVARFVVDNQGYVVKPKNGSGLALSGFVWAMGLFQKSTKPQVSYESFCGSVEEAFNRYHGIDPRSDCGPEKQTSTSSISELLELVFEKSGWPPPPELNVQMAHVQSIFLKRPEDLDLQQGSYYLEDLTRVIEAVETGESSAALDALFATDVPQVDVGVKDVARTALDPAKIPLGRWPIAFGLVYSQHIAVRTAGDLTATPGVCGINGPPGTGKTTLLLDVVAANICQRALKIAQLEKPTDGFQPDGSGPVPELCGYEMLVASSNNAAVENITADLPKMEKIDRQLLVESGLDYFSGLATDLLPKPEEGLSGPPPAAWGLIAAPLGKHANCAAFVAAMSGSTGRPSLIDSIAAKPPKSFVEARREFLEIAGDIDAIKQSLSRMDRQTGQEIKLSDRANSLGLRRDRLKAQALDGNHLARFGVPFLSIAHASVRHFAERASKKCARMARTVMDGEGTVMDSNFWARPEEDRERSYPWFFKRLNKRRGELFFAALQLHRAFLHENGEAVKLHLSQLFEKLTGEKVLPEKELLAAWRTLFLVVPVISTTFASFERLFRSVPAGFFGWVLIDEAGQALPQAAVGALWRSQRAVVIGDPLQIPPVIQFPEEINRLLLARGDVPENHDVRNVSLQQVADGVSSVGTTLKDAKIWVGAPLRVHRRCADPMFSISNLIAYKGHMVHDHSGTFPDDGVGESRWINVPCVSGNSKFSPAEGEVLLQEVSKCVASGRSFYVISPFVEVKDGALEILKSLGIEHLEKKIGTVHTFQGKEADVVYLMLGADWTRLGAVNWAASTPNILNVAVTRAKHRLIVIGDVNLWGSQRFFKETAEALPIVETLTSSRREEIKYNRLFVISCRKSKGCEDFFHSVGLPIENIALVSGDGSSLAQDLRTCKDFMVAIGPADVLAIVRGGGDVEGKAFDLYNSPELCDLVRDAVSHEVTVVTGLGHATDHFKIDEVASISCITPTEAGRRIRDDFAAGQNLREILT